uniref:HTH cro/C1-type domain-containing protein n=1 Tax=Sinocyclocheilus grahami TaxID=75366 RepID=A0A672RJS8_SINGR
MNQHDSCCYILDIIRILRINLCNLTCTALIMVSGSAGQNKQHLKGRQDKGLTQKDLATKIYEKPQITVEYESGKVITNNQVMGKIERAILHGKDIGQPLEAKPKKK